MKTNLLFRQFACYTATVAIGTALHFLFSFTGAYALAPISAVNESTWEHMKIMFIPSLAVAGVQYFIYGKTYGGFWWIKLLGATVSTVGIPCLFYTWMGAFGSPPGWLNVLFFFLSAAAGYCLETHLMKRQFSAPLPWIALLLMVGIFVAFAVFTFYPPHLPLFQDPITGLFGIIAPTIA